MPTFTDTHCHLTYQFYKNDLHEVIERAIQKQLVRMLIPAIDVQDSKNVIEICEKYDQLFAAVGVHPNDAMSWNDSSLKELRELSKHPKVLAIGEIGLDYYRNKSPKSKQLEIFRIQLDLAAEVNKPVIIHNRDASSDIWKTISTWHQTLKSISSSLAEIPGVFHAYSDDVDYAKRITQCGFMIGIGGPLTYKNAQSQQQIIKEMPLNTILLETDAPFLTPHPYRGKRNEPSFVTLVAEKIAEIQQKNISDVAEITFHNSNRLFNWSIIS